MGTNIYNEILMPINEDFLEVFDIFMDDNQKNKIRANNVRQYVEGIIDLLLRDKIESTLNPTENYGNINWKRKIKIIKNNYDESIANKIEEIFKIGGDGSHFNGSVTEDELKDVIEKAVHIVEDIFVKYFTTPGHEFGKENIFTIFSMLPLKNRIYILEHLKEFYINQEVVHRLSLAYVKNGDSDNAKALLDDSLDSHVIDLEFYEWKIHSLKILSENKSELDKLNSDYRNDPEHTKAIVIDNMMIVGVPSSPNVFETAKAVEVFKHWFDQDKEKYPEFINLFLYLMKTDQREYK